MMRSLFSGVAGLKNHQTRMDVTGNNIANVNTVGYKAGRTTFQDMLSQSVKGAAAPTGNLGGINPLQVGLGMSVASVDNLFGTGSLQATGKNTDLALDGDGFFIVSNGLETYYTRAGNFDFDELGNYVIPGTGLQVMGWLADDNGNIIPGQPTALAIQLSKAMPPKVTTSITFDGNLNANGAIASAGPPPVSAETKPTDITIYDSEGIAHKAIANFEKTGNNNWTVNFYIEGTNMDGVNPTTGAPDPTRMYTGTLTFNSDGTNPQITFAAGATLAFTLSNGAANMSFAVADFNVSALTQFGIDSNAVLKEQNGYTGGTLKRATLSVDASGVISGQFSNGKIMKLGQVLTAMFTNPAGLTKVGSSLFSQSNNSGVARWGAPGQGGFGSVMPSTLEMSNVDLSEEFTTMVTTQRGFQANSRIITTSDSMLEELVNLKR